MVTTHDIPKLELETDKEMVLNQQGQRVGT